ncbi:MAG: hypothetical protein ACI32N_08275 [Bulleidia sp.]
MLKIITPRALIPFQDLLQEPNTKQVYDAAMSHVKKDLHPWYVEPFIHQRLADRTIAWGLPDETLDQLRDEFERLDHQCPYVLEGEVESGRFLEYRILTRRTHRLKGKYTFLNHEENNLVIEPGGKTVTLTKDELIQVMDITFLSLWSLTDEELRVDTPMLYTQECRLSFQGIENTIHSDIHDHTQCHTDRQKQYLYGMAMIEKILNNHGISLNDGL